MTTNHPLTCPDCGTLLPADSPQQLCPSCLLQQVFASRTIDPSPEASTPPPTPGEIADKFPQFEITECLGRGGMGVVYKARQKSLNRWVAIKILAPEKTHDEKFAERFTREAHTLALLNHPNIVTVYDHGETDGLFYIVMEFVDGVNLRDLLREGKLEDKQALAIVPPICEALQYAHDKGIVHRDIKPENLLLDRDGRVKIADFGIASLVGASGESAGTPPYMAPEQSGGPTDHRADIYALGVVLYEMLTGERPAKDVVAPSRKVQVDVRLDGIVLRALEKQPELRYHSAGEFRTAVETIAPQVSTVPPETASSLDLLDPPWKVGLAAAVVLSILAMRIANVMLPLNVIRDFGYLLRVCSGLALVAAPFVGMAVAKALRQTREDAENVRWQTLAARLKAASVVAWLLAVPVIGFAIFFLNALFSERGAWNPALSEAVLVPLTILGAWFLPISGRRLWKTANAGDNGSQSAPSISSKAGLMVGRVLVGMRSGQRVIVWPNVVACFLLVALVASLGSLPFLAVMRLGLMEVLVIAIFGATIVTGVGITSGRKAPLDKLSNLDHPQNQNHPTSSAANQQSRSTGQTIALGCGVAVLVGLLMMILSVVVYMSHGKSAPNEVRKQSDTAPARVVQAPPFIANYSGGTVEIVALANYPEEKFRYWLPNGSRTEEWRFPIQEPSSWVSGKKMRMVAVRVRSQSKDASPAIVRFEAKSPHVEMGSSHYFDNPAYVETIQLFGADLGARAIDFRIGVADGDWETVKTLNPSGNAILPNGGKQGSASYSSGEWEAGVDRIVAADGSMTVSFRYSRHEDYETRMVVVRADGSKQKIKSGMLNGVRGLMNGMAEFNAEEAASMVAFESQRRPYQWVTFHHVSVESGHETTVEVKDSGMEPTASPSPRNHSSAPQTGSQAVDSEVLISARTFMLRHQPARLVKENLRYVLQAHPEAQVTVSADNGSLTVTAPADVLNRVATYIVAEDWPWQPDPNPRIEAIRKFLQACAEQNVERVASSLSFDVLVGLSGKSFGHTGTAENIDAAPELARQLQADWPGKEAAIRNVIAAYTKYPLARIRHDDPGLLTSYAIVIMPLVEFEGAPEEFGRMTFDSGEESKFLINRLPPWF